MGGSPPSARSSDRGRREIDAEGHVVTPGFVDGHTHFDAQVFWEPLGTSSCYHGVTSVVMGNCGFTLAPARPDARALVVRNLERAEDMDAASLAAGIDWEWETFAEYLDAVERRPLGINFAAQIGHSALRTWAMGERAFDEEASDDDLALMEHELRAAMHAGAIGFTTSRSDQHETSDDRRVASRVGSWNEVCRLVGVLGDLGVGVFELATPVGRDTSPEERARGAARDEGARPVVGRSDDFRRVGRTRVPQRGARADRRDQRRGRPDVRAVTLPRHHGRDVVPHPPAVRQVAVVVGGAAGTPSEQLRALRDESLRRKLVDEAHHGDYGRSIGAETPRPDFDRMRVFDRPLPPNPTVAEAAAARGVDPVELIIDLAIDTELRQFFAQPLTPSDDDSVLTAISTPDTVMTFSDSGAHVSQIADSSIQTHLLAYWVREREAFTLEEAIRMLTDVPARACGLRRPRARARGLRGRPQRARPRHSRTRAPHGRARLPRRRAPPRAEGHRNPRHDRGRRRRRGRRSTHRRPPREAPPQRAVRLGIGPGASIHAGPRPAYRARVQRTQATVGGNGHR